MTTLQIKLLGSFHLIDNNQIIPGIDSARLQSLLAYLILNRGIPQSRTHLSFMLWPDTSESQALSNLRTVLHWLRQVLPGSARYLEVTTKTVQWRESSDCVVDVICFEDAVEQIKVPSTQHKHAVLIAQVEQTVALYTGDLTPSLYDDWLITARDRLRATYVQVMARLIQLLEEGRNYGRAIHHAEHLLQQDPLAEETYLTLIRLHMLNNQRAAALRIYYNCDTVLKRELGVEPGLAIQELYKHLLNNATPTAEPNPVNRTPISDTMLVGRQTEWRRLTAAWQAAIKGKAHLVLLKGEAGIGKTRLAEELVNVVNRQGIMTAQSRSYTSGSGLAYAPLVDWLRTAKQKAHLSTLDVYWKTELARLLPELLVENPTLRRPEPVREKWQLQHFYEALVHALLIAKQPVLYMLDDMHWCDQETLHWLVYFLHHVTQQPVLVVGTARSEEIDESHPLTRLRLELQRSRQLTEIELSLLDATETGTLAKAVAGSELSEETRHKLFQETEGHPLFIVETVRTLVGHKAVLQSSAISIRETVLPETVQRALESRFSHLSTDGQNLASLASVIGREFTFSVLVRAFQRDERTTIVALDELWQRRLIREHGIDAYDFSHDKLREVAYARLSPIRKRYAHQRLAETLQENDPSQVDAMSGQIAMHYENAGLIEQAVIFYQKAVERAIRLYAHADAITYLNQTIKLLHYRPLSHERQQLELSLQLTLGIAHTAIAGIAAPAVEQTYINAQNLSQILDDKVRLFRAKRGLWEFYEVRAEYDDALTLAKELLELAQQLQEPSLLLEAYRALGATCLWRGAYNEACYHFEQGIQLYSPTEHHQHIWLFGNEPGVSCWRHLAWAQWSLGFLDQARQSSQNALRLSQELSHPYTLVGALALDAGLNSYHRDVERTYQQAQAALQLSEKYGFSHWSALATFYQGWALFEQGKSLDGLTHMQQGLDGWFRTGARLGRAVLLARLAHALCHVGQLNQGMECMEQAFQILGKTQENYLRGDTYRLRGELALQYKQDFVEATTCFQTAIQIARQQQAKMWELRAVVSLSRLWQKQDKRSEALHLLTEILDWFNEGVNSPDLQDARKLRAELA